jgi:hypothetical protein
MLIKGIINAERLREIKKVTKRGRESNLIQGFPPGPVGYGWDRKYHEGTQGRQLYQSLESQLPKGLLPGVTLAPAVLAPLPGGVDGQMMVTAPGQSPRLDQLTPGTPGWVVLQIHVWYSQGWYDEKIAAELNACGIPVASGSGKWRASRVREILINPMYAGYVTRKGVIVRGDGSAADCRDHEKPPVLGRWAPLISTELFWANHNRRAAKRDKYRDTGRDDGRYVTGGGPYMMAATARCGKCGNTMSPWTDYVKPEDRPDDYEPRIHYECTTVGCWGTSIGQIELDTLGNNRMIAVLSDETALVRLAEARDAEAEGVVAQARAEIGECQAEVAGLPAKVEAGDIDPVFATARKRGLEKQIAAARLRASVAGVPLILVPLITRATDAIKAADKAGLGAGERQKALRKAVARAWAELKPLERRAIVRVCAEVWIKPIGRGRNNQHRTRDTTAGRVHWRWLIGPDDGDGEYVLPAREPRRDRSLLTVTVDGEVIAQGSYTTAEKGALARALMAERGWNGTDFARAADVERSAVYYWLRADAEAQDRPYEPPPPAPPRRPGKTLTVTIGGEVIMTIPPSATTAQKGQYAAALMAEHGLNLNQCARAMGVTAPGVSYWLQAAAIDAAGSPVTT